jgi:hypothetical protein
MSFKIDIYPSKTLRIVFLGVITREEIKSVRENSMAMIRANELEYIFYDLQNAVVDIKQMEIFNYASTNKIIYKNITKTAVIYKTGRHNMQELTLFTRTANTKGFKVKLFNNIPDALKWLKF